MHISAKLRTTGDPTSEARKPTTKAVALGQVFTDETLAKRMVLGLGIDRAPDDKVVLDPCVGPNTFPSVISAVRSRPIHVKAFDIDAEMCRFSRLNNSETFTSVFCADYLLSPIQGNFDFAILNPPYVRQEWIREKAQYRETLKSTLGFELPGTSNLYVYFIVKALCDLKVGGKLSCIVYDSWQSTLYGRWLKGFLDKMCRTWRAEPAPAMPFEGKLIDATIIYAERGQPDEQIELSTGAVVREGFAPIDDLFVSRRGLRLKQANFFLSTMERRGIEGSSPFIKKIAKVPGYIVGADHPEAALLIKELGENKKAHSTIEKRLSEALGDPEKNLSILTWYRERPDQWCTHKNVPKDTLLFNYYLRHRPRHIWNSEARAYSDNFYGITSKSPINALAWLAALNATASVTGILQKARNQGAGLAKLQLFEYREAPVVDLRLWSEIDRRKLEVIGQQFTKATYPNVSLVEKVDSLIASVLGNPDLAPARIEADLARADIAAKQPSGREV
ncbi:Eco57I restriction-modification methylase domain-containing protein [Sulfitobacter sp. S190]|uniref:Eco57I restriction-modification methylase domain-containing protein n=1 Tax=Sulfitobacter sp. S190 TaxID=2867022 RepID=UPI0021A36196|nr:hypothetical protein [Sulfitobacter sp. S190]UWR21618.1 hypothetical protein K3756_13080 [Sulfitobacter sp. S190]